MTEVFFSIKLTFVEQVLYASRGPGAGNREMGRSVPVTKLLKSSVEDRKQTLQYCDTINATH